MADTTTSTTKSCGRCGDTDRFDDQGDSVCSTCGLTRRGEAAPVDPNPGRTMRASKLAASIGVDLAAQAPTDRRVFIELADETMALGDAYFDLVVTANLDWQVAEHVRNARVAHEHSANEFKAFAVRRIGSLQHTQVVFDEAVVNY